MKKSLVFAVALVTACGGGNPVQDCAEILATCQTPCTVETSHGKCVCKCPDPDPTPSVSPEPQEPAPSPPTTVQPPPTTTPPTLPSPPPQPTPTEVCTETKVKTSCTAPGMTGEYGSFGKICQAIITANVAHGHLKPVPGHPGWWADGDKYVINSDCEKWDHPGGKKRSKAGKWFGIECETTTRTVEVPCPDAGPPAPEGMGITLDAHCGGMTPNCGVKVIYQDGGYKVFEVPAGKEAVIFWDASYFLERPKNKIHDSDPRYPGPILRWEQTSRQVCGDEDCSVDCGACQINCHRLRCGKLMGGPVDSTFVVTGSGGTQGMARLVVK